MFNFGKYRPAEEQKPKPIVERFEGISDAADVKDILDSQGLLEPDTHLNPADYEAIVTRASKLLESDSVLSQDEAIAAAFLDRMVNIGAVGIELIKKIPVETLKVMFGQRTGKVLTDEEVGLFIKAIENGNKPGVDKDVLAGWQDARTEALQSLPADTTVVVDGSGQVVKVGEGAPETLLKEAADER